MAFPVIEQTTYTEISGLTTDHEILLPLGVPANSLFMVVFSASGASNPTIDPDNSTDDWEVIRATSQNSPTLVVFWKVSTTGFEYLRIKTTEPVRSLSVSHGISNAIKIGESALATSEYNDSPNAVPAGMDFTIPLTAAQKRSGETVNTVSKDDTMWMVAGVWAGTGEVTAPPSGWTAIQGFKKTVAQSVNEPRHVITTTKNARTLIEKPSKLTSTAARWRALTLLIFPRVSTGQIVKKLQAVDTMEVLVGIGEGPIKGPVGGLKGIQFNNTPVMANDGTMNFDEASVDFYPGNPSPPVMRMKLRGASNNIPVNITLGTDLPVVRPTRLKMIDYIDVRLTLDRLAGTGKKGPIQNTITFRIEYKQSSSSTWIKYLDKDIVIKGLTMSKYPKDYRIVVPRVDDTYDVRVTKITAPNTTGRFADLTFESIQEIIAEARSYPNTALLRLDVRASDQFSGFPTITGDYEGLIIRVPTNYDPVARTYTGAWDGTWKLEYTNNPALVLYDYVMNERYGMKSYYPEIMLDKYDIYEAAQWCDELVPDGQGGFQPRYTFNAYISEAMKGKELAQYIAGTFNSTFFDDLNGTAFLRVDKDDQAVQIFSKENIINGDFDYSYTDITSRFNDITVTFINPDLNWNQDRRRVKDDASILKYGRIPHDFVAIGCNNAHEALRRAHYKLITQQTETRIVRFTTNRLGTYVQLFDVILISDPDMGWGVTGRIKEMVSANEVLLRDPLYMEAGVSYRMSITLNDMTKFETNLSGTYAGDTYTLNVVDAIPLDKLPPQAVFSLESSAGFGAPRPFRVMKIEEADGNPDAISIEAVAINRNKWYDADNITNSGEIEYSRLASPFDVPSPEFVGFSETFSREDESFVLAVTPYFNRRAYAYYDLEGRFEVWSRLQGTDDAFEKRDLLRDNTIRNHPPGQFDFKVLGISSVGARTRLSEAQVWTFNVTNPMTPPPDVMWATVDEREIHWVYDNPPEDFQGFELRYHNVEGRTSWDDAVKPHSGTLSATSFYTNLIPASARVILIKAVDVFGVYSQNAAVIRLDENSAAVATNQVQKYEFHLDGGSNLVDAPRDMGNMVWTKQNFSVVTNSEPGPSGEGLADTLFEVETGDYDVHSVSQTITTDPSEVVYAAVDIKAEGRRYVEFHLDEPVSGSGIHVRFDLQDGVPVFINEIGSATFASATIRSLPDGWWRLRLEGVPALAGGTEVVLSLLGVGPAADNDPDAPMYGRPGGLMYPSGMSAFFYLSSVATFETGYLGESDKGYVVDLFSLLEDRPAWYGEKIDCAVDPADGHLKANSVASFYTGVGTAPFYTGDPDQLMYTEVFSFFDYITDIPVVHAGELIINTDYIASGYSVSIRPVEDPPAPWVPAGERPWVTPGTYQIMTRVFGGATRGVLRELTLLVDAEDQQEMVVDVPISNVGSRLPIQKVYSQIKVVAITILDDGGTAVNSKVLDYQTTIGDGPMVELRDNNNVLVSGRVTATIRGYV